MRHNWNEHVGCYVVYRADETGHFGYINLNRKLRSVETTRTLKYHIMYIFWFTFFIFANFYDRLFTNMFFTDRCNDLNFLLKLNTIHVTKVANSVLIHSSDDHL